MQLLSGKVIVSTRPASEDDQIHQRLTEEGAVVVQFPMIEISASSIDIEADKTLQHLAPFQWVVFTSSNGVNYFFAILKSKGRSIPSTLKFAVYGNRTGSQLKKMSSSADFIFHGGTSTDFLHAFQKILNKEDKILFIQGNLAPETMNRELSKTAFVQRINVYQTTLPKNIDKEILNRIINGDYDFILFTSPSGFINFKTVTVKKIDLTKLKVICIGQRTARSLIDEGVDPLIIADTPDAEGIIKSITRYYQNKEDFQTK